MSAFNALNTAIYSRLNAATALTALLAGTTAIYNLQAPDDAGLDYVVWNLQTGGDENQSAHRTKRLTLFVRGYSVAGPAKAGSIDAQIDTALHMTPLSVSGWANFWIARGQDFSNVEIDAANVKTWMAGAYYDVRIEKT